MIMDKLIKMNGAPCPCGKPHEFKSKIITGSGALRKLPETVKSFGAKKPFILSDKNTFAAAGKETCKLLDAEGISYVSFSYTESQPEPDEKTLGSAFMHLTHDCDMIIAVGSGVINDTCKLLSMHTGLPYVILATAPSMDGYESMTSSMTRDGMKISLPSRCADVIIGDTDVLCKAPKKLILSGIGDMLAKYISICEWRIASLICGEYYCEEIASLIRGALKRITDAAESGEITDETAIKALFDGLTAGSVAMNYAGISRPASGVEHYISHIIDMKGAELASPTDLHGIQCALGTLLSLRLYEELKTVIPNREKALKYAKSFDLDKWNESLRDLLGNSAEGMISLEKKEGKYDKARHRERLETIISKWDEILKIIEEELPSAKCIEGFMKRLGMPTEFSEIGIEKELLPDIFRATKDIREKYVLSRLLFDLGIIDEFAEKLKY